MSTNILVRVLNEEQFQWLAADDHLARPINGGRELFEKVCQEAAAVHLLVPSERVVLTQVVFTPNEKKMLRQTVPYTLEEELIEDVDKLHFALGGATENRVPVAVVDQQYLQELIHCVERNGAEVKIVIPELFLLPWQPGQWTLLIESGRMLVRYGKADGFAIDYKDTAIALTSLVGEQATVPNLITIYADTELRGEIESALPDNLTDVVQWRDEDYWTLLNQQWRNTEAVTINLLQGKFTRNLPWRKWWVQWRVAAILAVVALTVHVAVGELRLVKLKNENLALRTQIESVYREAVPKGRMTDPEKQLRRLVGGAQGRRGEGFVALLDKVATALAQVPELDLQNLNYSEQQTELRLTLTLPTFNDVEKLRADIAAQGLTAELTGSDQNGAKTRARLRVKS